MLYSFPILEMTKNWLPIITLSLCLTYVSSECNQITHAWNTGANGEFSIKVPSNTNGWKVTVTFDQQVQKLMVWNGNNVQCNGNVCTFENKGWNGNQNAGTIMKLGYQVQFRYLVGKSFSLSFFQTFAWMYCKKSFKTVNKKVSKVFVFQLTLSYICVHAQRGGSII